MKCLGWVGANDNVVLGGLVGIAGGGGGSAHTKGIFVRISDF